MRNVPHHRTSARTSAHASTGEHQTVDAVGVVARALEAEERVAAPHRPPQPQAVGVAGGLVHAHVAARLLRLLRVETEDRVGVNNLNLWRWLRIGVRL